MLVARRENLLEELAAKIQEAGGRALVKKADVTKEEQVHVDFLEEIFSLHWFGTKVKLGRVHTPQVFYQETRLKL